MRRVQDGGGGDLPAAFEDESIAGINLAPIDPDPPKMKGIRLQTDKLSLVNRRLQSLETKEIEMQTESPADMGSVVPDVDEATLIGFLRVVAPLVEEELEGALQSLSTFESYEPVWDDMDPTCEMVHEVWKEGTVDRQVTCAVWNCTGSMLACAYGDLNTLGWCDITASVCLWNIFRPQMVHNKPDTEIPIQGFVMCLAFHPTQPAMLAGGTYNGELLIWNTASTDLDLLVASSSIDDYFHREAIEAVEWIQADLSGKDDAYLIATVSGDGKVLIWDARENDLSYPSRGFLLQGAKKKILGGRSLSFSPLDPWLFVVGCEAGSVMRAFRPPPGASMPKPQGQYSWKPSAVALLDQLAANSRLQLQHHVENYCRTAGKKEVTAEVVFQSKPDPATIFPAPKTTDLEPHHGPVVCAAFSPFHRKLLLTGSTDGSVKMYDVLQQRALYTFYPPTKQISTCAISAVSWSSARPCVFAVAVEMGGIYVYDLLQSRQEPVLQLPSTGSGAQKPLSITFNPKQRGLLAVGDDGGHVRVFRLPFKLSTQQKDEVGFINRIMASRRGAE
mmetsp:Transcript_61263/g.145852  ORF Transcript_61263/g.145852 Transcript_61263/m.145852 type:complete len:560 (-) Transcript_61263:117-1796(-)